MIQINYKKKERVCFESILKLSVKIKLNGYKQWPQWNAPKQFSTQ